MEEQEGANRFVSCLWHQRALPPSLPAQVRDPCLCVRYCQACYSWLISHLISHNGGKGSDAVITTQGSLNLLMWRHCGALKSAFPNTLCLVSAECCISPDDDDSASPVRLPGMPVFPASLEGCGCALVMATRSCRSGAQCAGKCDPGFVPSPVKGTAWNFVVYVKNHMYSGHVVLAVLRLHS